MESNILKKLDSLKEKVKSNKFSLKELEELSDMIDYFIDSPQELECSSNSEEVDPTILKYLFYGWYLSQYISEGE